MALRSDGLNSTPSHNLPFDHQHFTALCSRIKAEQVCTLLHTLYAEFDRVAETLGVFKWATVGGARMTCTCGDDILMQNYIRLLGRA